jgi:multiple sugar transport system substrate-binding protein
MSKLIRFAALALLLSMIIAACGTTPAATTAPTQPVAASATPGSTGGDVATATTAPVATDEPVAATETVAPTEGPEAATEVPPSPTPITVIDEGKDAPAGSTVVKWFVGLGTGGNLEQVEAEQKVVDEYNSSNTDNIYIALNVIPNGEAYNVLATQIAAGTPPDIIGPVGIRGISFAGDNVMIIDDLIESQGVDLSKYDEGSLKAYQTEDGKQFGLPYAVFPSFILFNRDLFDEAGLAYPPQAVGEQYEGKTWDMDTLRELALKLTVDSSGKAADEEGFDAKNIVQFGFIPQWQGNILNTGSFFGAGDLTADDNSATIPDAWKDSWKWFYEGRHVSHFIPDSAYENSDEFGKSNVWSTGKVAMAFTHLWYTCCFDGTQVPNWDLAVIPEYNGKTTAKLHADTFAIMKQTKDPEAAFKAYMFLLNNEELRKLYGGLPPTVVDQPAYFDALSEKYAPNEINWDVALEMLKYPDIPSHEQNVPNYLKFQDRLAAFDQLANATPGLDLDAEIAKLETDLTAIFQGK